MEHEETRDSVVALGQREQSEGVDDVTRARQQLRVVKWRVRLAVRATREKREEGKEAVRTQAQRRATRCAALHRVALRCVAPSLQRPSRTFALGLPRREKENARVKDRDGRG